MTPEERRPLTRREFGLLIIQQDGKCGCGCGRKLDFTKPRLVTDEHLQALFSLGGNELENRSLWLTECSILKTAKEAPAQAKVRRHMNGKTQADKRKAAGGSRIKSRSSFPPKGTRKLPTKKDMERYRK